MERFNVASREREQGEGVLGHRLEETTSRFPTGTLLGLAVGSMIASAGIAVFGQRKELANFVGLWAPSFLLIGIYNRLSKLEHQNISLEHEHRAA
jgi:hypothetical protein